MSSVAGSDPATDNVVAIRPRGTVPGQPADRRVGITAAVVTAAISVSALAGGLYDFSRWGLLAGVLLAVLVGMVISGQVRSFGPLTPALVALVALAGWAAASMLWADSAGRAWTESNRLVLYAAALAVVAGALRTRRDVRAALAIVAVVIAAAALWTAVALLAGDAGAFLDHRLNSPIGYINGTAGLFLMGLWPLLAVAERCDEPRLSGAAAALAVVELNLLVLTQSRAIVPALLLTVLLALVAFPGRVRRLWALLAVAAGAAAAAPWTLAVYADRVALRPSAVPEHLAAAAALATLVAALAIGALWAGVTLLRRRPHGQPAERAATAAAILAIAAIALTLVVATGDPVAHVKREWHAFTTLQVDDTARTRFTGAGGFRYDLWRVALEDFQHHPARGVGAGSYGLSYYQQRRQQENVRQPHSLPLQFLAELGIVGGLLLLAAAVVAAYALLRRRRDDVGVAIAGTGMVLAWAVQTSVDWLYNLPGLTCIAIVALAAACADTSRTRPVAGSASRALLIAIAILVAVAAASLGRQYAAQSYASSAEKSLAADPAAALRSTANSLALNPHAVETYYTRAAAFSRFDEYARARDVLVKASAQEPLNFVPWALQGDLAVRRGDLAAARKAYRTALRLNPREPGLAELAADPRLALR